MSNQINRYRSFLRISMLVMLGVLVFDGGFLSPITQQLSDSTYTYLGSVGAGMFASVEPNELNTLTAQISEQQRLLDAREAALREREIAARDFMPEQSTDYSTYIISVILFILTVLLVLNYAMDWVRVKKQYNEKAVG